MTKDKTPLPNSVLSHYKGGHTITRGGYLFELCPDHPRANEWGYVSQHRLIVERSLGFYLDSKELVHHIDEDKVNNHISNLLVTTKAEHQRIHQRLLRQKRYPPITREIVKKALAEGGLKKAARILNCSTETIRKQFPDLLGPYKRKAPTKIDDPKVISLILSFAKDKSKSVRDTVSATGVCYATIRRICKRNNVDWIAPYRGKGEIHKQYRRKKSIQP